MSLRRQGTFEMSAPEVMIADVEPDTVLFHRDSEYEVIERSSVFEVFCYSLCVLACFVTRSYVLVASLVLALSQIIRSYSCCLDCRKQMVWQMVTIQC